MMKFEKYYEELKQLDVGKVLKDEPLYKHTTYRVGGPAKLFIKVQNVGELIEVIKYCRKHRIQLFVIGRGSNLLFSDKSFEGIIISLEDMNQYHVNGSEVTAQCGVTMIKLAYDCAKIGLSGFEFMGGIPGNIGGGIFMNAGAYKSCLSKVVKSVKVLDEHLKVVELSKDEMDFSYRHSIIQDHPKWIVLEATFVLENKSVEEINETLDKRKERRMSTQPWNKPSAGSVFRNPEEIPAWKLIEDLGLRGHKVGGAKVSEKHCNFIVNDDLTATAQDVRDLIHEIKVKAKKEYDIDMVTEVEQLYW